VTAFLIVRALVCEKECIWNNFKFRLVYDTSDMRCSLPAGLQSEGNVNVADRESLAVNGADTDTPVIGVHACELGDVGCHLEQHKTGRFFLACLDFVNHFGGCGGRGL
jgi:hypothetical protein